MIFSADKKPTEVGHYWALGATKDDTLSSPFVTRVVENAFGFCVPFRLDGEGIGIGFPINNMGHLLWGDKIETPTVEISPAPPAQPGRGEE